MRTFPPVISTLTANESSIGLAMEARVLPPSIHERTGRPYKWIGIKHLQDLSPGDLPLVTPDNMAELVAALEKLGYREPVPRQARSDDDLDHPLPAAE